MVVGGLMEVDYYDESGTFLVTERIRPGEALLHIKGGHGFHFPEASRVIEIKQGPYLGKEKDKIPVDTGSQSYPIPLRGGKE